MECEATASGSVLGREGCNDVLDYRGSQPEFRLKSSGLKVQIHKKFRFKKLKLTKKFTYKKVHEAHSRKFTFTKIQIYTQKKISKNRRIGVKYFSLFFSVSLKGKWEECV